MATTTRLSEDAWTVVFSFMYGRRVLACRRVCRATEGAFQRHRAQLPLAPAKCGVCVRRPATPWVAPSPAGVLAGSARTWRRVVTAAIAGGAVVDWDYALPRCATSACTFEWALAAGRCGAAAVSALFAGLGPTLGCTTHRAALRCVKAVLWAAVHRGDAAALRALGTETQRAIVHGRRERETAGRLRKALGAALLDASANGHADVVARLALPPWNAAAVVDGYKALVRACASGRGAGVVRVLVAPPWSVPAQLDPCMLCSAVAADDVDCVRVLGQPPFDGATLVRSGDPAYRRTLVLAGVRSPAMLRELAAPPWSLVWTVEERCALLATAVDNNLAALVRALGTAPHWDPEFAEHARAYARRRSGSGRGTGLLALPPFCVPLVPPYQSGVVESLLRAVADGVDIEAIVPADVGEWKEWVSAAARLDLPAVVEWLLERNGRLVDTAVQTAATHGATQTIDRVMRMVADRRVAEPDARALFQCLAISQATHAARSLVVLLRPGSPWREHAHALPGGLEAAVCADSVEAMRALWDAGVRATGWQLRLALVAAIRNDRLAALAELGGGVWKMRAGDIAGALRLAPIGPVHGPRRRTRLVLYGPPWNAG